MVWFRQAVDSTVEILKPIGQKNMELTRGNKRPMGLDALLI